MLGMVVNQNLDKQARELEGKHQQVLTDVRRHHDGEISATKAQHAGELKNLRDDHTANVAQLRKDAETEKANALKSQLEKITSDHESMIKVLLDRRLVSCYFWHILFVI